MVTRWARRIGSAAGVQMMQTIQVSRAASAGVAGSYHSAFLVAAIVSTVALLSGSAGVDSVFTVPPYQTQQLEQAGVAAVYTPKDFELNRIMSDVVRIVERASGEPLNPAHFRRHLEARYLA